MTPGRTATVRVLIVAAVMGLLGDAMLRVTPWGVGAALWLTALVGAWLLITRRHGAPHDGGWLIAPAVLAAGMFAWRDSAVLKWLDGIAVVVSLALLGARTTPARALTAGLAEYALTGLLAWANTAVSPLTLVVEEMPWSRFAGPIWQRRALATGRGFLVAMPLLLVFGGLFASADAAFEQLAFNMATMDLRGLYAHLSAAALCAWLVAGYLRGALSAPTPDISARPCPPARLGVVEIGVVLGMLDVLFMAFVLVQFRYFFGGRVLVESTTGLTYAEYARRGFFELVTVAALAPSLLLALHWSLRPRSIATERLFRLLATALLALLGVIMVSAIQRMRLYQREYGFTELRLYATAFMCWLAVVLGWFALTVLRGRRERFAFGALASGFAVIVALHALNPDALIARTNTARAQEGRRFDAAYVASLSADAAPALVDALPRLAPEQRCVVASRLLDSWAPSRQGDWRTWSWSRSRAEQAVREQRALLERSAC